MSNNQIRLVLLALLCLIRRSLMSEVLPEEHNLVSAIAKELDKLKES